MTGFESIHYRHIWESKSKFEIERRHNLEIIHGILNSLAKSHLVHGVVRGGPESNKYHTDEDQEFQLMVIYSFSKCFVKYLFHNEYRS